MPGTSQPPVLVVDDELVDHFLLETRLKKAGVHNQLIPFTSAEELQKFLEQGGHRRENTSSDPCVLFIDLHMPTMNGFELIAWINAHLPRAELRIIVMSFSDTPQHRLQAEELGVDAYCVKFPSPEALAQLVSGHSSVNAG